MRRIFARTTALTGARGLILTLGLTVGLGGCGGAATSEKVNDNTANDTAGNAAGANNTAQSPATQSSSVAPPAAEASAPVAAATTSTSAAPGKELVKAAVGMGEKGRGYGGGVVTAPVKAYWNAQEQLTLGLIEHAMQLYKAADPDSRGPKTQEEFMQKIVHDNDIRLPALPAGQRYVYNPRTEELLIEKPKEP